MSKVGDENKLGGTPLRSKAWLSKGVESLYARQQSSEVEIVFDIVIIGSGYGGAIAASELSQFSAAGLHVGVLERGREFSPGSFPNSITEAPTELRKSFANGSKPKGNLEGLFDVRLSKDLTVIQANGLGGGSLINAGVMARADTTVFNNTQWPTQINLKSLTPFYNDAEELLGSVVGKGDKRRANTIFEHKHFSSNIGPSKYESLRRLSQGTKHSGSEEQNFTSTNITVNMHEQATSSAGVKLNACNLCGDCASGCNNNSKISLDKNLLAHAAKNGVEIFTGVTVNSLSKEPSGEIWSVQTVYTDKSLRSRQQTPYHSIKAKHVIVAAGALGSTEILSRSQNNDLTFSGKLGQQVSSNGDMMLVGYNQNQEANAVASANVAHSKRKIGPTITGMIDLRKHADQSQRMVIQEMAVPAAISHFFTELYSTTFSIRNIWSSDRSPHHDGSDFKDPAAIDPKTIRNTSLYAAMGDDNAEGKFVFTHSDAQHHEGTLQVSWPSLRQHSVFSHQLKKITALTGKSKKNLGGMVIPNPFWQLLTTSSMQLLNLKKGPPLTVHPLGGCPMGESIESGVTNHQGRVFNPKTNGFHKGLLVLDGAIMPTAVGINPALTISAVCLKAIRELIADNTFDTQGLASRDPQETRTKEAEKHSNSVPIVRAIEQLEADASRPIKDTKVSITERLVGYSQLENDHGKLEDVTIEITLWSKPLALNNFNEHRKSLRLQSTRLIIDSDIVDPLNGQPLSKIRIYKKHDWEAIRSDKNTADVHEVALDNAAQFIGSLNGHLQVLGRAESYRTSRIIESSYSWLLNRGIRDIHQSRKPLKWELNGLKGNKKNIFQRIKLFWIYVSGMFKSFSRAGEIRTLNYQLSVSETLKGDNFNYFNTSKSYDYDTRPHSIIGSKNISYIRRSNPWMQLSEVHLEKIPNSPTRNKLLLKESRKNKLGLRKIFIPNPEKYLRTREAKKLKRFGNKLSLDLNYLAKVNAPLMQITEQENQVQALLDLASFATYVTRMLVGIHFYSFRAPEMPAPREHQRQASKIAGLPQPIISTIKVDEIPDNKISSLKKGDDVSILLTHYAHPSPTKLPILMIHGYSASSTTFAHQSLPNSLAKFCFEQGRDVWLLDLRTSCALASARYPWDFESVAEKDIPAAVNHIYNFYKEPQCIDIITHCMGSVMLGMSILRYAESPENGSTDFFQKRINRIVFSQATPAIKFTQDNNFRSFATSYLKELVPDDYQFQPKDGEASSILDRVLYTLPYPAKEYDILNAPFTPSIRANYARTRHRMDAFFTRTFELNNVSPATLDCIDDFFGPIHVNTIIQASQFANNNVIADNKGHNEYLSRERLKKYWGKIPTMSFHSKNNGLIDYSTGERSQKIFREGGVPYETILIEDERYGHQDSIISPNAHKDIYPHISGFLDRDNEFIETTEQHNSHEHHLVIEAPAYGPMLVESSQQHSKTNFPADHIRVSFGTNAARAVEPYVVFLPVIKNGGQFDLACQPGQPAIELINHYFRVSKELKSNNTPWWKIHEVPKSLFNSQDDVTNSDTQGLVLFLIYDDLHSLCPDTIKSTKERAFKLSKKNQQCSIDRPCTDEDICQALLSLFNDNECHYHQYSDGLIQFKNNTSHSLSFALGSCQYPSGMLDRNLAYKSYERLNQRLISNISNKPTFMTLVGDQIYADATAGLLDPSRRYDQYTLPYLRLYEQPPVRSVLRKLASFNMLDDHELVDNWEPVSNNQDVTSDLESIREKGVRAFLKYQRGEERPKAHDFRHEKIWYQFSQQQHDFFMCDTRTQRAARTAGNILSNDTTILGRDQHEALEKWLSSKHEPKTKFVLSSSMLLPRHATSHGNGDSFASAIRVDSWDGYPVSLHRLLAYLVDNQIRDVVFLSGDDHIACFAEIQLTNLKSQQKLITWSAHCPGLHTPFPFANGRTDDFEGQLSSDQAFKKSEFEFKHNQSDYHCKVNARFRHSKNEKIKLGPINIEVLGGFLLINSR